MKRTGWMGLVVVLLATLAVAWPASAATTTSTRTGKPKDQESSKTTTYIVVQMKDMQGKVSFEAIPSKSFSDRQKQMRDEYTRAIKEWEQARAKARKDKVEFTDAKPLAPSMTKVGSTTFKDLDKAREAASKLQDKYEALQEKKKKTEEGDETEKPTPTKPEGEVVKPADTNDDENKDDDKTPAEDKKETEKPVNEVEIE